MLNGVDPKTGEKMADQSVMDNMITFLIAGHETTSGLLSFAFYFLLKNPSAYKEAQQEVDAVIGKDPIKVEHLSKLPYINAVSVQFLDISQCIVLIPWRSSERHCGSHQQPLLSRCMRKRILPLVASTTLPR